MIPFNVPYVSDASKKYVLEVLEGNHQQGDGIFTTKTSRMISDLVGGGHVLLTPSCTHALEMACMLAKIGPGDEVILPSYTFTSAATAITKFGAVPVFVDIKMDTKGIDVEQVREAISPKTKAISWVNYAGVAPDIEGLQSLAKEFNLILIEDNAHGLGGSYKGKALGSFGDFATQSFHATKNIQCGEGGALIINNAKYVDRAEIIREKGTDRSKYFRGEVDKYQWVDKGSSYLLAESLAAILLGQIENFREIQRLRKEIWLQYSNLVLGKELIHFPSEFRDQLSLAAHIFYIEIENQPARSNFVEKARDIGISVTTHYQPLHNSRAGARYGISKFEYENTIKTSTNLLRFPIYIGLSENSFEKINTLIRECQNVF